MEKRRPVKQIAVCRKDLMANKSILTIGFQIPGYSDSYRSFSSDQSLLDADIILFAPDISPYRSDYSNSTYQGKLCLGEDSSFQIQEDSRHWRKELSTALEDGKTIIIFFKKYQDMFVFTGQKDYSGTGRNTRTTNHVMNYNNYNFLPISLPPIISKEGSLIIYNNDPLLSTFWKEFKEYCNYESYIDGKIEHPLFFTKTGNKPLGGMFTVGKGHLIILPVLDYDEDEFIKHDSKTKKSLWTKEALRFGNRLFQIIIDIDKSVKNESESTSPPDWANDSRYLLPREKTIKKSIEKVATQIDNLVTQKNDLLVELENEREIKKLCYEKSKPLESAVIKALKILGYTAENFDDGTIEFDQIIISPEGDRFIGETEGRDNQAINIDKLRQIATNIQDDLQREEILEPATGILFGNGYRLSDPDDRAENFTNKCIKSAEASNIILVNIIDLFPICKYLKEKTDEGFKKECRNAIKESRGKIVNFPTLPSSKKLK